MKTITLALCLSTLFFASCKKYENGPSISLRSKSSRLEGKWYLEKLVVNNKEEQLTPDDIDDTYEFKSDNKYEYTDPGYEVAKGTWDFTQDKKCVILTNDETKISSKLTILKLTNEEFWYYIEIGTDKGEFHFRAR